MCEDGRSLPHNHRQKTYPNGTLVIEDLQRSRDGGQYHCVAENNRSRTARRDVSLNIMAPPVVEPFSFASALSEGKRATVTCVVSSGDLPIRISWMKDGQPLPDDLRGSISTVNEFTSTLSFSSVSQIHNGNYTCIASNPVASRNHTATMIVKGVKYHHFQRRQKGLDYNRVEGMNVCKCIVPSQDGILNSLPAANPLVELLAEEQERWETRDRPQVPPKWKTEPSDKSVVMGQPVMFDCQANGYPDPKSTKYIETFVMPLDMLQKALQGKVWAWHTEEVFNGLLDFSIASKASSSEILLQNRKQMEVTWCEIRTVI
ncbi:down syndrome cell adhesion molecule-like protein Dscam2 [Trichonephila clavipes]|nr:down syndrome cell adhesion molecule-like protein Dscam2 [Trichonephila clavipes]